MERTGWGKSSVYFVATRILRDRGRGPTIIVSPLLSLMRNQIEAANQLGINALTVNSTNRERWPELQRSLLEDQADALLISPERLANDEFVSEVLRPNSQKTGLLVVDDIFDSGWTLTIASALLRQAGSGPVWPLALATSSMSR